MTSSTTLFAVLAACMMVVATEAHELENMPINPALGVPGYPDCVRAHPEIEMSVADAAQDLICEQKGAAADAAADQPIKIGCVGDSITAGVHSSGGIHPYVPSPAFLQFPLLSNPSSSVLQGTYSLYADSCVCVNSW